MKRAVKTTLWLIVTGVIIYFVYLNSESAELNLFGLSFDLPVGVLFIFALILGGYVVFFYMSARNVVLRTSIRSKERALQLAENWTRTAISSLIMMCEGDVSSARELFSDVNSPGFKDESSVMKSIFLCMQGKHEEALKELPPDSKNPLVVWRKLMEKLHTGKIEEAIREYEDLDDKSIRKHPLVCAAARDVYASKGDWERAVGIERDNFPVKKFPEESSRLASILTAYAQDLIKKEDYSKAEKLLNEAISLERDFIPAYAELLRLYLLQDRQKKELSVVLERVKECFKRTGSLPLLIKVREVFVEMGEPEGLLRFAKDVEEASKHFFESRVFYLSVLYTLGMAEEAQEEAERVLEELTSEEQKKVVHSIAFLSGARAGREESLKKHLKEAEERLGLNGGEVYRCVSCGVKLNEWEITCPSCKKLYSIEPAEML